jgi:hypothetical protein
MRATKVGGARSGIYDGGGAQALLMWPFDACAQALGGLSDQMRRAHAYSCVVAPAFCGFP